MPETRTTGNNGFLYNADFTALLHGLFGPAEVTPGTRPLTLRQIQRNVHDQWDHQRGLQLCEDITFTFEGTPPPFQMLDCFGQYGYRLQPDACDAHIELAGSTQLFTVCYVRVGQ